MKPKGKAISILLLVLGITVLHYGTRIGGHHYHILYRELYFFPIILAAFWFGLRKALWTSCGISVLYLPFAIMTWEAFSPADFTKIMELILYNVVAATLGFLRDRQQAEQEELLKSESLAAMGKAVLGVAHDMKTPLIAIGGFSKMVQRKFKDDDSSYQKLDVVVRETQRLENMLKNMLDFGRPLKLDRSEQVLNKVVEDSLAIAEKNAEEKHIKIERHLDLNLPLISMDIQRMKQVVINLVNNAIEASSQGQTIAVTTSRMNGYSVIDIIDYGSGIPREQRKEIFTPFFSTKKEGTGLGLPIANKIVESHDGRLEILDNAGVGITFRILLPRKANQKCEPQKSTD